MKKILIMFFLTIQVLFANDNDIILEKSNLILQSFKNNDINKMAEYFSQNEVNIFGEIWVSINDFKNIMTTLRGDKEFNFNNTAIYSFQDCINDTSIQKYAKKVYRVFDSNSLLSITECNRFSSGKYVDTYIGLVFQSEDDKWIAKSIFGMDVSLFNQSKEMYIDNPEWTMIELKKHKITFPLLTSYQQQTYDNHDQIDFILPGSTVRDAVLNINFSQIDLSTTPSHISNPLYFYSNNVFQMLTKDYKIQNKIERFFPNGFLFEYELYDEGKEKNKGITLIIKDPNSVNVVLIQFFAYYDVYQKYWKEIDTTLRNIKFIN